MTDKLMYQGPHVDFNLAVPAGTVRNDPVVIGNLRGIAITDRDTLGYSSVKLDAAWAALFTVEAVDGEGGNRAVAIGDRVFFDSAETIQLNRNQGAPFFGIAVQVIAGGSSAEILVAMGSQSEIAATAQGVISSVFDLSGAAVVEEVLFAAGSDSREIRSLHIIYIELTSADAGVTVTVGKDADADYFYTGTSLVSQSAYTKVDLTLLKTDLEAGAVLTASHAGGKTGTGTAIFVIEYV